MNLYTYILINMYICVIKIFLSLYVRATSANENSVHDSSSRINDSFSNEKTELNCDEDILQKNILKETEKREQLMQQNTT